MEGQALPYTIVDMFVESLPAKPYCADQYNLGLKIKPKQEALRHKHIQLNHPAKHQWITFDIDRKDAYFAAEEANLPEPTCIVQNPLNGHAHLSYMLKVPVLSRANSRTAPLRLLAAVQRALTRRLEADLGYRGVVTKNPLHKAWKTDWQALQPYRLDELADCFTQEDMAPFPKAELEIGVGRNCSIFDSLRKFAYKAFPHCKAYRAFRNALARAADNLNDQFKAPLSPAEIRGIVKSVAKWVWRKFHHNWFSKIQQRRGRKGGNASAAKRWAGHVKETPWVELGMSKATYYRRKKAGVLNE